MVENQNVNEYNVYQYIRAIADKLKEKRVSPMGIYNVKNYYKSLKRSEFNDRGHSFKMRWKNGNKH